MAKAVYQQRVAYVEFDVPHALLEVAALIDYNAYSRTELDDKCDLLRRTVKEKLQGRLKPRTTFNKSSARQVPAHISDQLLQVFNEFEYPELNKLEEIAYKKGLELWVRSNLKTR